MKEEDNSRLVEVFNGSRWEAELIKGLLESNDIEALLKDGLMTAIAPYISPTVSVMVKEEDYESAMEVIRSRSKADND
ncbi:DUF2007 domain-containing protein [Oscillospiraceae bacterium N12]|jgi:hypothetical protein|uniref:DUF2007 domain-containing protein n=1 Tax=Jilunia laotingensis TaxID=2763675 RepID=A0A926IP80_9BACT|nr:DUF2007 domain-containing protein [Jilunia laotingensis]MBC8592260.1 DUF2007 domain-containing protein [Jilunia laotingensis]